MLVAPVVEEEGHRLELDGLDVHLHDVAPKWAAFDLCLFFRRDGSSGLELQFLYDTALYWPSTVQRIGRHYKYLLDQLCTPEPRGLSELSLVPPEERRLIAENFIGSDLDVSPRVPFYAVFESHAKRSPKATALTHDGIEYSYQYIDEMANKIAHLLSSLGVGAGSIVAISMQRNAALIVSMYGVLKTGAAYLPLDPKTPRLRVREVLHDAMPTVFLCQSLDGFNTLEWPRATTVVAYELVEFDQLSVQKN